MEAAVVSTAIAVRGSIRFSAVLADDAVIGLHHDDGHAGVRDALDETENG